MFQKPFEADVADKSFCLEMSEVPKLIILRICSTHVCHLSTSDAYYMLESAAYYVCNLQSFCLRDSRLSEKAHFLVAAVRRRTFMLTDTMLNPKH